MNEPREFINTIPSYPAQCNEQCTLETLSCQQKAEMKQPLLYPFPELSHSYRLNTSLPSSTTNITQCNLIGNKRKRNQYSKERQDDKEKYKRGGVLNDDVKGGEDEIKNILANQTVDQLQNELDFLTNECSTILIILDSLRNAFTANISTKPSRTVNFSSMTTIINFTAENTANERTSAYPFKYQEAATTTEMMQDNNKKWCHQSNTNVEMNREMRIAFDDLTLQVRQLEKKLERLEDKSQNLYLEINTANQRKSKD
ncbi:uncharacterized protein BX663DRAFT_486941 [Cokeromyces recurvatus]|uniref:uncharacterized protein n=1 Tax=Cokeromyces recurvatus TaxID=90255 RepID=UPI00221F8269|nr:uncharacterized protein BX663DRAFT_486941 [Cokeromyces recurvatus]KAI7902140.1 hypothetical protein BX663DRAFT_486941 [Cokeromyces recurvatus]